MDASNVIWFYVVMDELWGHMLMANIGNAFMTSFFDVRGFSYMLAMFLQTKGTRSSGHFMKVAITLGALVMLELHLTGMSFLRLDVSFYV